MRVALVHDYLNQYGGAERVLSSLSEMFPKAPIYTLFYDQEQTYYKFAHRRVIPSVLKYVPGVKKWHRLFIPLMPMATGTLKIKGYDIVISSSASYAKGVNTHGAFHITYCHTPLRYAWEANEYLKTHPMFRSPLSYAFGKRIARRLQKWDARVAQRPNIYLANSQFIADKIKRYYKREALVIHPPVDDQTFYREKGLKREYYLAIGRMLHYKRFDLVVDAFNKLELPLKIIGNGPELNMIKKRARSAHITFLPFVENEDQLRKYYNQAKALIFPQVEDFGLVAAEALSCGTPVIAYNAGGVKEIIDHQKTGILFNKQTPEALIGAVKKFEKSNFHMSTVLSRAKRFSKQRFQQEIMQVLQEQGF